MSARFPLEGQAPAPGVRRRQVLGATGAALAAITLGFHAAAARSAGAVAAPSPGDGPAELAPNAWRRLAADGTVTVLLAHTEMGQGTATGLAMIVAEELDADWSRVRTHTIEPDGKRFMITGGSYAMSNSWKGAREAGAALRQILLMAAARQWEVPPEQCRTEPHEVRHEASGRRLTYGELVRLSAGIEAPKEPPLKAPAQYRLIGRPLDAQHVRSVVTGQASAFSSRWFQVELPISLEAATVAVERKLTPANAAGRRVLVVDDNRDAADSLAALLELNGHRVETVYSGRSAVDRVTADPDWEVFLLDIGLPDMTGYELASALRAVSRHADAQFVALTGYGQPHDVVLSQASGFGHHLVKPADVDKLLSILSAPAKGP